MLRSARVMEYDHQLDKRLPGLHTESEAKLRFGSCFFRDWR